MNLIFHIGLWIAGYCLIGFITASVCIKFGWSDGSDNDFSLTMFLWPLLFTLLPIITAFEYMAKGFKRLKDNYVNFLKSESSRSRRPSRSRQTRARKSKDTSKSPQVSKTVTSKPKSEITDNRLAMVE